MTDYLRVTRDDYHTIRRACRLHTFAGPSAHFRRFLVESLRSSHARLAAWVDGLSKKHVRIIRSHLAEEVAPSRS
jgi:hypothetical protein